MPRPSRLQSETGIYHVMSRGSRRKVIFHDKDDKKRFINIILNKKKECEFTLYAYCIMDNHYHLLLQDEEGNLPTIMKKINSSYATYYNERYEGSGHVFQDRYRSEPVNSDGYLLGVIRYIHNNPVKASMTKRCQDYPWSSYSHYINYKKNNELLNVSYVLDLYGINEKNRISNFIKFTEDKNNDNYLEDYCEKEEELRAKDFIDEFSKENKVQKMFYN